MSKENPLISVLVLNYNGEHLLDDCLNSLFAQNFDDFEIVVADNNSSDDSVEFIRKNFPKVKIAENEKNFGFAKGNNLGLKACRGEWIFFLNNDTKLLSNCIKILAENIRLSLSRAEGSKSEDFIFAPMMLNFYEPNKIDSAGDEIYPWGYAVKKGIEEIGEREELEKEVFLVCGGAAIFHRNLLQKLNGFDEDFFLYYEDVDLSLRARHLGAKIFLLPQAKVLHKGSATVGKKSASRLYYIERNRFWTKIKNFPLPILLKYAPHSFVCDLFSFILWTKRGFFAVWIKSRLDMLRGIPRMLKKRREIFLYSKITVIEFEKYFRKENFIKWLKSLAKQ